MKRMRPRYWIFTGVATMVVVAVGVSMVAATTATGAPSLTLDESRGHVPAGCYLAVDTYDESGTLVRQTILDPAGERAVEERPIPGWGEELKVVSVYDATGVTTFDALAPQLLVGEANYSDLESRIDSLAGMNAEVIGTGAVDGRATIHATVSLGGDGQFGSVAVDIDQATGVRVREEWRSGNRSTVVKRRLVPATSDLSTKLDRARLEQMVESTLDDRISALAMLLYPVMGLKPGHSNLRLLYITPGTSWDWVRIAYESADFPGVPALTIETWNLAARPDYPGALLPPFSEAVVQKYEQFAEVLCYARGNTGIQIVVYSDRLSASATDVAANLAAIAPGQR